MARSILASTLFSLTLLLTYVTSTRAASNSTQCPADPYLDPQNDPCNALGYIASIPPTAVAFSEYPVSLGMRVTQCSKVLCY